MKVTLLFLPVHRAASRLKTQSVERSRLAGRWSSIYRNAGTHWCLAGQSLWKFTQLGTRAQPKHGFGNAGEHVRVSGALWCLLMNLRPGPWGSATRLHRLRAGVGMLFASYTCELSDPPSRFQRWKAVAARPELVWEIVRSSRICLVPMCPRGILDTSASSQIWGKQPWPFVRCDLLSTYRSSL